MSEIILNENNFDDEVLKSDIPVLVDFWASWCGPCKMLSPIISQLAEEYSGRIKVCKVNVDEQPVLAERYQIQSIPTMYFFKDGKISDTSIGFKPKNAIIAMIEK